MTFATTEIAGADIESLHAELLGLHESTGWREVGRVAPPDSIEWLVFLRDAG